MKKLLSILMSLLMVLGLSSAAYAEGNGSTFTITGVTLNTIGVDGTDADGNGIKYVSSFPADIPVTGTVSFSSTENTDPTIQFNVYVNDIKIPDNKISFVKGYNYTYNFSGIWTVNNPGTYTVRITAKQTGDDMSAEETVSVMLITVTYPAAPAVAAHLLKDAGISPKYSKIGNYISDVAAFMGSTTSFWDVVDNKYIEKSDVTNYRIAVARFLISKGAKLTL